MKILKFGGTSVGSVENVRRIGEIVLNQQDKIIVVVSALGGVTDQLLAVAQKAASGEKINGELIAIRTRHEEMIRGLFNNENVVTTIQALQPLFDELEKIVQGITLIGELTPKTMDKILGFGERLSSILISRYLDVQLIDSLAVIRTDRNFGKANVDFDVTYKLISEACSSIEQLAVAP